MSAVFDELTRVLAEREELAREYKRLRGLEEQLDAVRAENKKLITRMTYGIVELQKLHKERKELRKERKELSKERDFYREKCFQLLDCEISISQHT
jgi:uncharacterized coiled-coil DUF342 family protein